MTICALTGESFSNLHATKWPNPIPLFATGNCLTLFTPAYLSLSKTEGEDIVPPLNVLGLGGVRVPILFGNHLPMNDWPYSKGFMKFGYLEPSKIMFDFWKRKKLVERCLTQFVNYEILVFLINFTFFGKTICRVLCKDKFILENHTWTAALQCAFVVHFQPTSSFAVIAALTNSNGEKVSGKIV